MPGERGFGRGRGGIQRKLFFLESCLLVLLHREPGYGYSMVNGLLEFGFQTEQMDISIIYRALRDLEAAKLVNGAWDENSLGPQRRVYTITPQGESALTEWIQALRQQRKEIETLEAAYDAVKKKIMKIAVSVSGNTLDSPFDPRFERAAAFCVVDSETGVWTAHENPAPSASGGAGVQAAQFVAKLGAQVVISGAYSPNAFDILSPVGIEMYLSSTGKALTAAEVLALFKTGKLTKTEAATHAEHHEAHY